VFFYFFLGLSASSLLGNLKKPKKNSNDKLMQKFSNFVIFTREFGNAVLSTLAPRNHKLMTSLIYVCKNISKNVQNNIYEKGRF